MRQNWLTGAVLAAAAVSVPVVALTGPAKAAMSGKQQAVTTSSAIIRTLVLKAPVVKAPVVKAPVVKAAVLTAAVKQASSETYNQVAADLAKTLVGDPYAYGGTSPAGFDCSGLTQWVYQHTGGGKAIPRMAEDQFLSFHPVSHAAARPGDLVFFHDTSDMGSYVYHVGIYEGGDMVVAATVPGEGVQYQSFSWAGDTVSFGTITH